MSAIQTPPRPAGRSKASRLQGKFSTLTPEKRDFQLDRLLLSDEGHSLEVIDGELVEKGMGAKASKANMRLGRFLSVFIDDHKLGHLFDAEMTFKCFSTDKLTIRKPDISFVKMGRFPNEEVPEGHILFPPDLAVEVVSTHDRVAKLERKLEDYRQAGVFETWIVTPATRSVLIRRKNGIRIELNEHDIITCEELLPGFALKISEIFE